MKYIALTLIALSFCLGACSETSKIDNEAPYAIEISAHRHPSEAFLVKEALERKGLKPYIVCIDKKEEGKWFKLFVERHKDPDEVRRAKIQYEDQYNMPNATLVNFNEIRKQVLPVREDSLPNYRLTLAKSPEIAVELMEAIKVLPYNPSLSVHRLDIFHSGVNETDKIWTFKSIMAMQKELAENEIPGIAPLELMPNSSIFIHMVLENIFSNTRTTVQLIKPKANALAADTLASLLADKVLNAKKHLFEEKVAVDLSGNAYLKGFKLTYEVAKGVMRYVFVLYDEDKKYVLLVHSQQLPQENMMEMAKWSFDEAGGQFQNNAFVNALYTLPEKQIMGDKLIYIGFQSLRKDFADLNRGSLWARRCVGNHYMNVYFLHPQEGLWKYRLYDLQDNESSLAVYKLIKGMIKSSVDPIQAFGSNEGYVKNAMRNDVEPRKNISFAEELRLCVNSYVASFHNEAVGKLSKVNMLERLQHFQLDQSFKLTK